MVDYVRENIPPEEQAMTQRAREYTGADTLFAWMCVIAAYLFCRVFPVGEHPFGGLLFLVLLFGATLVFAAVKKVRVQPMPVIATVSALLVSGGLFLCANTFLHTLAYLYALVTYVYVVYALLTPETTAGFSNRLATEYLKALVILPFCSFGSLFGALFSGRMKAGGKQIGKVLIGVALAVIPTAMAIGLLSYDEGFSDLLSNIFDWDIDTIFSHIGSAIFALPIGLYAFGLYVSSIDGKGAGLMTEEACAKAAKAVRIAPAVTVIVGTVPLLFVYVVFFLSQWDYYMSAFTGVLPEGFSYAEYAREGFFQLCAVAVINLVVIVAAMVFMKRREDGKSPLLTALVTLFSASTLLLIVTAISKMMLYIDSYGLTPRRVYATWFMAVIALVFLVLTVGQFVRRLPMLAVCGVVAVVMFAGLSLCGADSLIAQYNVDRYMNGTLESVDMIAMEELGDAAIPALVELAVAIDEQDGTDISKPGQSAFKSMNAEYKQVARYLAEYQVRLRDHEDSVWELTLPKYRAEQAMKRAGLL